MGLRMVVYWNSSNSSRLWWCQDSHVKFTERKSEKKDTNATYIEKVLKMNTDHICNIEIEKWVRVLKVGCKLKILELN